MYTCNNDHIQISWEINVSCPMCHERKHHLKPKIDFYLDGRPVRMTINKDGRNGSYVHLDLFDLEKDVFIGENYIQMMDLFNRR